MNILFDKIKHGNDTIKNPLYDNEFSFGKIDIDYNLCSKCGICKSECLVNAIDFTNNTLIIDEKKCIFCNRCIDKCPTNALIATHDYKMASIEQIGEQLRKTVYKRFKRSLVLRSVDVGSCNACLQELSATQNNYYALSRFGISFTASPRHADGIVVTGPLSINMKDALLKVYEAMPNPKIVIALGTCAHNGGIFKDSYGCIDNLDNILPVDLVIPGCPPSPQAIIYSLLKLLDRIK